MSVCCACDMSTASVVEARRGCWIPWSLCLQGNISCQIQVFYKNSIAFNHGAICLALGWGFFRCTELMSLPAIAEGFFMGGDKHPPLAVTLQPCLSLSILLGQSLRSAESLPWTAVEALHAHRPVLQELPRAPGFHRDICSPLLGSSIPSCFFF